MIRYNPKLSEGLNNEQIEARYKEGLVNYDTNVKTRSIGTIISTNIFTLFNLLNLILALAIISVNSYRNLLFMGVVICNILISTIQELRAKKIIDKLSVISSSKLEIIRNNKVEQLSINQIVIDDLIKLKIGNQIVVDSIVIDGECEVDESFITGEAKTIYKKKDDLLLSGSFIVSGSVIAKVEHVGLDNYTATISKEAKYIKKVKSEIMTSLNKILKIISIVIIPIAIILFIKQTNISGNTIESSVVNTVAALIGMIPEGLVLLTSTVFAVAVVRLSKYKVLVQELYSIETLSRIDTLCLDKTGTITEGTMELKDIIVLDEKFNTEEILSNFAYNFKEVNQTLKAIQDKYSKKTNYIVEDIIPFSSIKKWSGVVYQEQTFILGAPEFVLNDTKKIDKYLQEYTKDYRVLLLAHSKNKIKNKIIPSDVKVVSLILIQDKIRSEAPNIIDYFNKHNVDIKIISGDNPLTVASIAKRSGIKNYDKYIDLSKEKDINYDKLVDNYTIFGRVNPKEKKELILALKRKGKKVAMTGDGVNDVLALKEADCSISFKSGMEAARNVSQLILLDSNFNSILEIVKEGRRSINNIERSATLFLVKTTFATILAVLFLFINLPYPFIPIQLTLTSTTTIGIPSLILALEPNHNIVRGNFLTNVISKALPAGLTMAINIIAILILGQIFNIELSSISTMCVISNAAIGFLLLYNISKPFNLTKKVLLISMLVLFLFQALLFNKVFSLVMLKPISIILELFVLLLSIWYFKKFQQLYEYMLKKYPKFFN